MRGEKTHGHIENRSGCRRRACQCRYAGTAAVAVPEKVRVLFQRRGGEKHATDMVDHKRYLDCIAIEKRLRTESGDAAPVRESLCIQCYFHFDLGVKR